MISYPEYDIICDIICDIKSINCTHDPAADRAGPLVLQLSPPSRLGKVMEDVYTLPQSGERVWFPLQPVSNAVNSGEPSNQTAVSPLLSTFSPGQRHITTDFGPTTGRLPSAWTTTGV